MHTHVRARACTHMYICTVPMHDTHAYMYTCIMHICSSPAICYLWTCAVTCVRKDVCMDMYRWSVSALQRGPVSLSNSRGRICGGKVELLCGRGFGVCEAAAVRDTRISDCRQPLTMHEQQCAALLGRCRPFKAVLRLSD